MAGIAEALFVHLVSAITPGSYGIPLAFDLMLMAAIEGTGSITGATVAAVAVSLLGEALTPVGETLGLYGLSPVLIALGQIVVLRLRLQGLFGSAERALPCAVPQAATWSGFGASSSVAPKLHGPAAKDIAGSASVW